MKPRVKEIIEKHLSGVLTVADEKAKKDKEFKARKKDFLDWCEKTLKPFGARRGK